MKQYDFSAKGFPLVFSDLVASATMQLPPLTGANDAAFLRTMLGKAINTFWSEYIGCFPEDVQAELKGILDKEEKEPMLDWYGKYANFEEDADARELAASVLDALATELPEILQEEYAHHSAQNV